MKRKNFKRSIYTRTFAGFLLIWFVLMTVCVWFLLNLTFRRQFDAVYDTAYSISDRVFSDLHNTEHTNTDLVHLLNQLSEDPYVQAIAVYEDTGLVDSVYDSTKRLKVSSGPLTARLTSMPAEQVSLMQQTYTCDLRQWLDAAEITQIQRWRLTQTQTEDSTLRYELSLFGFWIDGQALIPKRVLVVALDETQFMTRQGRVVQRYEVQTPPDPSLPYYDETASFLDDGDLLTRTWDGARGANGRNDKLRSLAQDADFYAHQNDFLRTNGPQVWNGIRLSGTNYWNQVCYICPPNAASSGNPVVVVTEFSAVREALPTLLAVCISSLLMFLCAALLVAHSLCKTYAREQALAQARRETANALAHDLKTPISLIRGYAENLLCGAGGSKQTQYLTHIVEESDRMNGMLTTMLDFARLERDDLPYSPGPVALDALAAAAAAPYRTLCADHGLSLTVDAAGTLTGDAALLQRALDNLLANAVRHTPPGGTVTLTARPDLLTVRNTGDPIPDDIFPRIWEPYFRGDAARSADRHTGLGLAIVAAVGRRHGFQPYAENTADGVIVGLRKR